MTNRAIAQDACGRPLAPGMRVRIVGVPDLSDMSEPHRSKTAAVFEHIRGSYKRIHEIDENGFVMLMFSISAGPHRGWHSVLIEPELLRVPKSSRLD